MIFKSKKWIAILLLFSLVSVHAFSGTSSYAVSFPDTKGHWAEAYIEAIAPSGVINGYPDGQYKPNNTLSRIEYIAIIVNALGISPRSPINGEYWGLPFIESAISIGLITSSEFGEITPSNYNQSILREEMASIVVNAYVYTGATVDSDALLVASQSLNDFNTVSPKYLNQAISSVALGILTGLPDNTFGPKKYADRAQAAVVSYKLLVEIGKLNPILSEVPPTTNKVYAVNGIGIGDTRASVIASHGNPLREDQSEYGFKWLIYHDQYKNYFQVGIQNDKVVALYTASNLLSGQNGLKMQLTKSEVTKLLGNPVTKISKGNTDYLQYSNEESATYFTDDVYITAYFDTGNQGKLFSVKLIDRSTEVAMRSQYGTHSDALRVAYEKQIFDLTNVFRRERNLSMLKWSDDMANVARLHSKDMAVRDFFDHTNPSGYSPFDRMIAAGIDYMVAAENIAAGYTNAFSSHSGWVNSPGHRLNLVRDVEYLGVGVYFGGKYLNYYTQNFYTP